MRQPNLIERFQVAEYRYGLIKVSLDDDVRRRLTLPVPRILSQRREDCIEDARVQWHRHVVSFTFKHLGDADNHHQRGRRYRDSESSH